MLISPETLCISPSIAEINDDLPVPTEPIIETSSPWLIFKLIFLKVERPSSTVQENSPCSIEIALPKNRFQYTYLFRLLDEKITKKY